MRRITAVTLTLTFTLTVLVFATGPASAASGPMVCPVPSATFVDSFGAYRAGPPVHAHQGVDMMAAEFTPIVSPADGQLEQHGTESFYLTADDGTVYFGTHLSAQTGPSRRVTAGERIGLVGHTGNASAGADHLHFEIHPNGGAAVNPTPYVDAACSGPTPAEVAAETVQNALEFVSLTGPPPTAPFTPQEVKGWHDSFNAPLGMVQSYRLASFFNRLAEATPTYPAPDYPFTVREAKHVWNDAHSTKIARPTTVRFAAYLNAVTEQRLRAYALALYVSMLQPSSCSGPADCPALIRRVFTERGLGYQAEAAVRVASCESGFNPRAYNPSSGASGLFQHLSSLFPARAAGAGAPGASAFDPYVNTVAAANMVAASGWSAWVCRP